jgi:hypothetical protein
LRSKCSTGGGGGSGFALTSEEDGARLSFSALNWRGKKNLFYQTEFARLLIRSEQHGERAGRGAALPGDGGVWCSELVRLSPADVGSRWFAVSLVDCLSLFHLLAKSVAVVCPHCLTHSGRSMRRAPEKIGCRRLDLITASVKIKLSDKVRCPELGESCEQSTESSCAALLAGFPELARLGTGASSHARGPRCCQIPPPAGAD